MHLTRNDLSHERVVRLTHAEGQRGPRPSESLGMDCAVLPEEWVVRLASMEETLNHLVEGAGPNGHRRKSLEDIRRLRHGERGEDVCVYHGRLRRRVHYVYGVRCARDDCPCALERAPEFTCPRRYQGDGERSDRLAPRILIVDADWNHPDAIRRFLGNVALWHQRVASWSGPVRTLAVAVLGDGEDTAQHAKEVAETLFEDLAENPEDLAGKCFSAMEFWRLCARQAIERCQDFCGPDAIMRLSPDHVVERVLYLQRNLNRDAIDGEHRYKYPLAVSIQRGEAEVAKAELQSHMIRLLQAGHAAGRTRGKRSRR